MQSVDASRRNFFACVARWGVGSALFPGVLWGQVAQSGQNRITAEMLRTALAVCGLEFDEATRTAMLREVNRSLERYEKLRKLPIPPDIAPPFHFSPLVPGMTVNRTRRPFRMSPIARGERPADVEAVAHWPVRRLAELVRTRKVTSVELTRMYLARLHRYNERLHFVVTFLDEMALEQAAQADREIASGRYRGPLHGIPWGAKDIIAVKGAKTTWGSGAYEDRTIDSDASVVAMLREAGAVLLAKLTTGELAHGDRHHLGQTRNPWNPEKGSSGSSAGPAAATIAGCVGFALGTETAGSILSPSLVCGVTGLRPTFGRISRHGVMALAWTLDRVGPMCRHAEDCALVMHLLARPDGQDMSVADVPFNWEARMDLRKLRVGYVAEGFEKATGAAGENGRAMLERVRALGIKLQPVTVPDFFYYTGSTAVEKAAAHSELFLSTRSQKVSRSDMISGFQAPRLVSAVDYLVSQRARTVLMQELAAATAEVDVWLTMATHSKAGAIDEIDSATQRHTEMANSAGYPALALPSGSDENGLPTGIAIYGRPFADSEVIALGKACQDASGIHLKPPPLFA